MSENSSVYTVFGVDVISYSLKSLEDQVQAQEMVDRCLRKALKANPHWKNDDIHWIDAGDGGFLLLSGQEHKVIDLLAAFDEAVSDETKNYVPEKRVTFRYALHCDRVKMWDGEFGKKFTGNALNNCARLLGGMNKEQQGQAVCSGAFWNAISEFGKPSVEQERLEDTEDKHGITHEVYNIFRQPGFGVMALESEKHVAEEAR